MVAGGTFAGMGVDCVAAECVDMTAPNDDCVTAEMIASLPALIAGDTRFSMSLDQLGECGDGSDGTRGGVWYSVVGTGNEIIATTCEGASLPGSAMYDSMIRVYTGDCNDPVCVNGNDDSCIVNGFPSNRSTVAWNSEMGVTYNILVSGFNASFGAFELSVFENVTAPCCFPDTTCMDLPTTECSAMGGIPNTDVADCGAVLCPDLRPANDACENAEPIEVPIQIAGSTATATPDDAPTCNDIPSESPGVWYSVVGTGRELTATTCMFNVAIPGRTTFQTRISVYQDCGELTCVASAETGCAFAIGTFVSFCADEGETYLIHLHGNEPTARGEYELAVYPTGVRCSGCICEFAGDPETVDIEDVLQYVDLWLANDFLADIDGGGMFGGPDIGISDLLLFLDCYFDSVANAGSCL